MNPCIESTTTHSISPTVGICEVACLDVILRVMNKAGQVIGANLKIYRKRRKVTQESLSERTGLSVSYIAFIEARRKVPSIPALESLAHALSIKVTDLIRGL